MIHIIDDYFLLAGSITAVILGGIAFFLTPYMTRRAGNAKKVFLPIWISRSALVLITGVVVLGAIASVGTENEAVRSLTLISGLALLAVMLTTGPRVYAFAPKLGRVGMPLEIIAALLMLIGSIV
ncbi:hypothetical protein DGWBC_0532 [Dehalogenimonas sp. WBC-2]|nr:hypothetical protein DGWBC_0532 [Dehalogenimonas sp. WBC-2]